MTNSITDPVNILIVDDREENIIALEALIERDDVNLISTTSPNEALRICWEKDISIALLDVQMPEMDGFELAQTLKNNQRTKEILIIFVTAISKEAKYAVQGLSSGAIDYLYKPLDPLITSAKVDSFIKVIQNQRELKRKNLELERSKAELIIAKEEAEKARKTKETFFANMSHELRTPINGISGLAHLLKNTPLNDEQARMVHLLEVSSQSLLGVINDVLDISKIESGKFKIVRKPTHLFSLTQSIVDLMKFKAEEKHIGLFLEIEKGVPENIMADSLRLNQILMNLLGNAVKFTEKGSVTLRIEVLGKRENGVHLQFSVIDTGIGISEASLSKIFGSYEQAEDDTSQKYGGTGLGLTIVKKLAELKGGTLNVTSKEGKGSIFTFTNWYQQIEVQKKDKPVETNKLPQFQNVNILLAEDNTVNQFIIRRILAGWNINVEVVEDGEEVLEKLAKNSFDLILMDTHMPKMGGFEATRRIRADFPVPIKNIPIISLSAAVLEGEQQAAWDAGVNDILSKPFEPAVLHQKISSLVKAGE